VALVLVLVLVLVALVLVLVALVLVALVLVPVLVAAVWQSQTAWHQAQRLWCTCLVMARSSIACSSHCHTPVALSQFLLHAVALRQRCDLCERMCVCARFCVCVCVYACVCAYVYGCVAVFVGVLAATAASSSGPVCVDLEAEKSADSRSCRNCPDNNDWKVPHEQRALFCFLVQQT